MKLWPRPALGKLFSLFMVIGFASGCIGDDIIFDEVEETIRILNPVESIGLNESYQFDAQFTNNIGQIEDLTVLWESTDITILDIDQNGMAMALQKGEVEVSASVEVPGKGIISDKIMVMVDDTTSVGTNTKSGSLETTSSYTLQGDFTVTSNPDNSITISLGSNYKASTSLPGLYIYLGNNPTTVSGAFEIGPVQVFLGAHTYNIPNTGINDYSHILYWCKPFNVKVGEGVIQ